MSEANRIVPLTCHGHSRPVPHLSFSPLEKDDVYYMVSACKGTLRKQNSSFPPSFLPAPYLAKFYTDDRWSAAADKLELPSS